jgi:hypothetical protein
MSRMITRKGKSQTSGTLVPVSIPESYTISDTNNHDGMEHYLSYVEILDMFENEIFPSDDPDIEAYINIRKRGIHTVVARPEFFPYNDNQMVFFISAKGYRVNTQCFRSPDHLTQRG